MNCNCFTESGKNCIEIVPIFSNLSHDEMMEVAKITRKRTFEKNEMIYMAGDKGEKLYVINSGKVKIARITDTGKEQVIRVLGPGEFMGELSLFSTSTLKDNGQALSETVVCIIDGKSLKLLMKKHPEIAFKVMEELSERLEDTESLIENISLYSVERRIAQSLIKLSGGKEELLLKIKKGDWASHLGMSQETLSRRLTIFQDMGLIKLVGHRKIILLDKEALQEIK